MKSFRRCRPTVIIALSFLVGCSGKDEDPVAAESTTTNGETPSYTYYREYIFVGPGEDGPLVAPLTFSTQEMGSDFERGIVGWLARGETWDRFIDESLRTSSAGGVWRIIPQGNLNITAGGAAEIEAFRYERGERRLRLDLRAPLTGWNQGGETRFRLLPGSLAIGTETVDGSILEILRVEEILDDGWPPSKDFDTLFLTSGDSIQLIIADIIGEAGDSTEFAWTRTPAGERTWDGGEIRWADSRPYEEARRDVPRSWNFRIAGAGVQGMVEAVGYDAILGPERAGRRAVEIRSTVKGWMDVGETRLEMVGIVRHTQQ